MERAASEVDELMTTIAKAGNVDATRIAVLACLHLQDRVHTLEHELERVKHRVGDRSKKLAELLDQVIDEEPPAAR